MRLLEEMKELTQLRGISGCEDEVREYLIKKIEGHCDSYKVDNMGNLIVHKKGKKAGEKRVLFSAHMDEVGFIITHITAEGMLHFETVGGVTPAVTAGRPVLVGKKAVPGVIGTRPIHLLTEEERKDYAKVEDMRIDIGAKDKKEAEEMVSLGDMATFIGPWKELGENTILARAIDDRAGCALLLELVRSVRKDLEAGEPSQAMRTLCAYEQQAHELYESWDISDAYAESGTPDDLAQLMEDELLPAWDEDEDTVTENDGGMADDMEGDGMNGETSAAAYLLRAVGQLNRVTANILEITKAMVVYENAIDRILNNSEMPENDCAD